MHTNQNYTFLRSNSLFLVTNFVFYGMGWHYIVNKYLHTNQDLICKTIVIFLDVRKAFADAKYFIIRELEIPTENDLIRSYLTNRLQVVKINNEYIIIF